MHEKSGKEEKNKKLNGIYYMGDLMFGGCWCKPLSLYFACAGGAGFMFSCDT